MGKSVLRNPVKWNRYIAVTGVFRSSIDTMINKYLLVVVNLILVGFMLSGAGASAQGLGAVVESQPRIDLLHPPRRRLEEVGWALR